MVADGNQRGIRHLVLDFWDQAADAGLPLPTEEAVTASAIGQARQRLPEDFFRLLLNALADEVAKGSTAKRWRGRRVYAVDGQKLNVGTWPELKEAFGVAEGSYCPQVLMSALVDVLTRTPVDYEVDSRLAVGERQHLLRMLPSIDPGDLVILDRGYPSHEVLQELVKARVDFLVRVPCAGTFKAVDEFAAGNVAEKVVTIEPPSDGELDWEPLRVRLVRMDGPHGEAIYVTSLTSSDISLGDISKLYHLRWESEEYFKMFTSDYAGQRQFRSRTPQGIRQEIGALTLFLAIGRVLATVADQAVQDPDRFVSQKGAVLSLRHGLLRILLDRKPDHVLASIQRTLKRMTRTLDRRRPSRAYPRRSFRPRPKWGPSGRVGA